MHELSITRNIVSIVLDKAAGRTVRRVHLKVGALAGIETKAIDFCYDMVSEGTPLQGSELVIHEIEGRGQCSGCEQELCLSAPVAVCPCERRAPVTITAGEELLIASMEV
jgi:hydrogenase nickel incorporation protein HypA/HybF